MPVTGDELELELELPKLDPLDCCPKKPLDDEVDDEDDVPDDELFDVVVVVWVVAVVWLVVARWLPMVTPNALKPSMATTANPRFMRPAIRSASDFERLGTAGVAGGLAGAAGR